VRQLELGVDLGGRLYVDHASWVQQHVAARTDQPTLTRCGLPILLDAGAWTTRQRAGKPLCPSCSPEAAS
jgi:hypothetical protein